MADPTPSPTSGPTPAAPATPAPAVPPTGPTPTNAATASPPDAPAPLAVGDRVMGAARGGIVCGTRYTPDGAFILLSRDGDWLPADGFARAED